MNQEDETTSKRSMHGIAAYNGVKVFQTLKNENYDTIEMRPHVIGEDGRPMIIMSVNGTDYDDLFRIPEIDSLKRYDFDIGQRKVGKYGLSQTEFDYVFVNGTDPETDTPITILFGNVPTLATILREEKPNLEKVKKMINVPRLESLVASLKNPHMEN